MKELSELLINKIKSFDIISFDLFDTLIKRNCFSPDGIIKRLDLIYKKEYPFLDLYKERLQAESESWRLNPNKEVCLKNIYAVLVAKFPNVDWKSIEDTENELEINSCVINPKFISVLKFCYEQNKTIVIATDMYLERRVIDTILKKNSINYDFLFLSCECGCSKRNGSMYDIILNEEILLHKKILHIGDNFKSDYIRARIKGIDVFKIDTVDISMNLIQEKLLMKNESYRDLVSIISNNFSFVRKNDFFYHLGVEALGPVLYGFCVWLKEELIKQVPKKIFFLARDGQIIKKQFDLMNTECFDTEYMYASRRSLIVPTLWNHSELNEIQNIMFWPRLGSVRQFLRKIGIDKTQSVADKRFPLDKTYEYSKLFSNSEFIGYYNDIIKPVMINNSKGEFQVIIEYLKQINFEGKVAIVDIGWNGNMQRALEEICLLANIDISIEGFYVGLNPNSNNLKNNIINAKGYLFDHEINSEYYKIFNNFITLFELLFSANHGTVHKFEKKDSGIVPVFCDWEFEKNDKTKLDYTNICCIQEGAADLCSVMNGLRYPLLSCESLVTVHNIIQICAFPKLIWANRIGELQIVDDEVQYLARPREFLYYLVRPKYFIRDLIYSPWKVGFLKRLFKINLPYNKAIMRLRKNK